MNPTRPLPDIDDLDRAIVSLSTRINAATYELLVLIRQFDECARWRGSQIGATKSSYLPLR